MARIQVQFGSGSDSFLFSLREQRFFSYEQDKAELHARYGGKQYYFSRSGLSGKGFLNPSPLQNDLIEFGGYRTDARGQQFRRTVHRTPGGREVFGYVGYESHKGIMHNAPVVLTDGQQIIFCGQYDVAEKLQQWDSQECEERTLETYDRWGDAQPLAFRVQRNSYRQDWRRFADLRQARAEADAFLVQPHVRGVQRLGIYADGDRQHWLHVNSLGYLDQKWDKNPLAVAGDLPGNWQNEGGGLFWRRSGLNVYAFTEIDRPAHYAVDGQPTAEYEESVTALEWFSKPVEHWRQHFAAKVLRKMRQDWLYAARSAREQAAAVEEVRAALAQAGDVAITAAHSIAAGNCPHGTAAFRERFGLGERVPATELATREDFPQMALNFYFRKAVAFGLREAGIKLASTPVRTRRGRGERGERRRRAA